MARESCCPVVELRQYTLKPEGRETLIRVFDAHFIEGQERTGMNVIGQFRDRSDANRFVWFRGFSDMETRRQALSDFYSGPVWKEYGPEANETMIDSDDVLLLKPVGARRGFAFDPRLRPPRSAPDDAPDVVAATIYPLGATVTSTQVESAASALEAAFAEAGATLLALLVTEHAANTFPRLPVREDANVLVSVASYPDEEEYGRSMNRLKTLPIWKERVERELEALGGGLSPDCLLLQPTSRSFLRHR